MSTEAAADGLCFEPAWKLARWIQRRDLSARELLDATISQIESVNPSLNAIVTLTLERAAVAAKEADELAARPDAPLPPLHGLPIAHKDTHETAGIRTTFGSPLFENYVPETDALVVEGAKRAGAICVGKTNVPEFGAGSHTFNSIFGTTSNPYDLSRSAGGSSGGAAAALAAGLVPLAEGSDMGGSLRNPASFCNVVGLRPSPGRVPSWPSLHSESTLTVQGPMGRTVADAALLLSVLAGPDRRSPIALQDPADTFRGSLDMDLTGVRIAIAPDFDGQLPFQSEVTAAIAATAGAFEALGCHVETACPDMTDAEEVFRCLRAWEFASHFGEYRKAAPEQLKPSLIWNVDQGLALSGADVSRAVRKKTELYHVMRKFFDSYDALVLPVSQVVPFDKTLEYPTEIAGEPQENYLDWMRSAYYISATGCPALAIPAGFTPAGLPVGMQIVGPHRSDLKILRIGHAFESATAYASRRPAIGPAPAR